MTLNLVKPFLLVFAFIAFTTLTFAQVGASAHKAFDAGNYQAALPLYLKALKSEPNNAYYNMRLGQSYLYTFVDPLAALDYLLQAENGKKIPDDIYDYLAEASAYHLDYDQALFYLKKYEEKGAVKKKNQVQYDKRVSDCIAARDLLKYPVDVSFKVLGSEINSEFTDYHPFVTKDGETLYFTSRRKTKPGQKEEFDGYYPSDIFISIKDGNSWGAAELLPEPVNTPYDEQVVGITNSGDSLFFYIDHLEQVGDISVCARELGQFNKPVFLAEQINSDFIESACSISDDGNTLIFSSDRPEGYGGLDIYMAKKLPSGQWGNPENLGEEINSALNEDFPTLSGDGLTMYFSSDGHPGMGGYDLFFSTWDVQNKVWSKPQNMGYPINSPYDNKTISFNQDGDRAYVTRMDPGSDSQLDIYEVTFHKEISDDPAIFHINIPQISTIDGSAPAIVIKNEMDNVVGEYMPNKASGRYVLSLHPGKYFLYVDAQAFQPYTEILVVNNYHKRQEQNVKIINLTE